MSCVPALIVVHLCIQFDIDHSDKMSSKRVVFLLCQNDFQGVVTMSRGRWYQTLPRDLTTPVLLRYFGLEIVKYRSEL